MGKREKRTKKVYKISQHHGRGGERDTPILGGRGVLAERDTVTVGRGGTTQIT